MTDSKKIDLIIRAEVQNADSIGKVARSIADVQTSIKNQVEAAKKGIGSIDDLKAAYSELESIADRLKTQANLGDNFLRTAEAIQQTEKRVAAAKAKFDEYAATLGKVDERTDVQENKLLRLRAAYDASVSRLDRLKIANAEYGESLTKQGIALTDIVGNQARLESSARELGLAFADNKNSLSQFTANLKEYTAASDAAADKSLKQTRAENAADDERIAGINKLISAQREQAAIEAQFELNDAKKATAALRLRQEATERKAIAEAVRLQVREEDRLLSIQEQSKRIRGEQAQDTLAAERADQARIEADSQDRLVTALKRRAFQEKQTAELIERTLVAQKQKVADELAAERADYAAYEAGQKRVSGLRALAAAAAKTTVELSSMANASVKLAAPMQSLQETIRAIVDPAQKTRESLSGLSAEVSDVAAAVSKINGPVAKYQENIQRLAAANREISKQAGLIDTYRKTEIAVSEAATAFERARQETLGFAAAVRAGKGDTDANTASLRASQTVLAGTAAALRTAMLAAAQSRDALRGAGIEAKNLAIAESQLADSARQATTAQRGLTDAVQKFGVENQRAATGGGFFGGGGQKGVALLGFLRQEIIGATTAVIGLYGAFELARKSIEALSTQEQIKNKIAVAIDSNDPGKIGVEMDYVRKKAEYFGVALNDLASSYGTFSIASKSAGYTVAQSRYAFEQLSGGMRVLGLSADQTNRAFTQVQQILSKTKPELEDIKTIAEAGFAGVQGLMARGLREMGVAGIRAGTEIQDMGVLMKKGLLDSQTAIFALAKAAETELGGRIPEAIKSLRAEQGRFQTSVTDFQTQIATSGFADAYTKALGQIREFFGSVDGQTLATNLSKAFALIADAIVFVVKNLSTLIITVQTLAAIWAVNMLGGQISNLITYSTQLKEASKNADAMTKSANLLRGAMLRLNVAVLAFQLGRILADNTEIGGKAWIVLEEILTSGLARLTADFDTLTLDLSGLFQIAFQKAGNFATKFFRETLKAVSYLPGVMGGEIRRFADTLKEVEVGSTTSAGQVIKKKLEADLKKIQDDAQTKFNKLDKKYGQLRGEVEPDVTDTGSPNEDEKFGRQGKPGKPSGSLGGADDKAAAKLARLLQQVDAALNSLEARVQKAKTETLESQLKALDAEYENLEKKIKGLGPVEEAEAMKRLAAVKGTIRVQLIQTFTEGIEASYEKMLNNVESMEAKAGKAEKLNLDARLGAIDKSYADFYRDLEKEERRRTANGVGNGDVEALRQRAQLAIAEQKDAETKKYNEAALAQLGKDALNLQKARDVQIEILNQKEAAGVIASNEAYLERNRILATSQPGIVLAAETASRAADEMARMYAIPDEQIQAFKAKMLGITASVNGLKQEVVITGAQVNQMVATSAVDQVDQFASSIAQAARGTKSWSDTFKDAISAFGAFAADFLKQIAKMILQQIILNALQGGAFGSTVAGAANSSAGKKHSGGLIGPGGNQRNYPAAWFANAPRYHAGGIAGLASDEYPTILQRNEEVLSKDSPRNIMNGQVAGATNAGTRVVLVDDRSKIPEAMASAEGERVVIEHLRRNQATVKKFARG